jgi:hypothetical protein
MTRTELIIQLLKVAIGLAFGAYFVWWSLQVLDRLTPEYDARTLWSPAHYEGPPPPVGSPMAWTSPSGNPKTARQRIGYAATREAAMAAFAKSWRRE